MLKNVNTVIRFKKYEILKIPFLSHRIPQEVWPDKNLLLV